MPELALNSVKIAQNALADELIASNSANLQRSPNTLDSQIHVNTL
jgi:hypothetical protein